MISFLLSFFSIFFSTCVLGVHARARQRVMLYETYGLLYCQSAPWSGVKYFIRSDLRQKGERELGAGRGERWKRSNTDVFASVLQSH